MGALLVILFFIGLPLVLGYATASLRALILPGALFLVALAYYESYRPGPNPDEVDVLPGIWLTLSGTGVVLCLAGVAVGRRKRSRDPASRTPRP
jgi:hypothetical protein